MTTSASTTAAESKSGLPFVKGHGTQNDFVILTDPAVEIALGADLVAALCDRQRGIGSDGLLRVARSGALVAAGVLEALPDRVNPDDWFMDYRNADGSIAEMCGNGVRVFAHHLRASGLVGTDEFTVGSRAGARPVVVHSFDRLRADVSVQMGPASVGEPSTVRIGDDLYPGVAVDVGNPHLACVVPELDADGLAAVDFSGGVVIDPEVFAHGANVELLTVPESVDGRLYARMRVFERGVGETRSCGTGLVAAAAAALRHRGERVGELVIDVPGGRVEVRILADDAWLRGPSELVADGALRAGWDGS
ncbi:diaminopimelate epimerase [Gordonia polyisoprenivorans]|uniref:diaminopimelate epimerase n=1 Tax=Gordonia polyisoprenivorans TaxID=84595 RepID=UPI001B8D6381|nr:diaminopimelate epimerase [Gordonia polyisoprenivorans]QUD85332.1 diaminopimelate epimerase [Gordonia polyisoprenivorans]UZF58601.1 diaminopimelate epimerase [Gordonia polyisoprenivorans]